MYIAPFIRIFVATAFLLNSLAPAYAQSVTASSTGIPFSLPKPGSRVDLSPAFQPALIKGLKVHPDDPFMFDFIVDPGDDRSNPDDFKKTAQRMINYFLASLATPQKDLWVNLSPVEKDRIIPDSLIKTELGRDLLAEDYMLKQIGASLIYPESGLGKAFWNRVYDEAYRKFGVTEVPVNMFNKIWILPEKASVFEKGNTVYIVSAHLKVMLEEDLLAQKMWGQKTKDEGSKVPVKELSKQILREIVIPAIEKEVNEDKNFAQLRQVFYALILAQWYQDVFKESILNRDYSGQKKISGIDVSDPKNKELIYHQYMAAYKKGVFNYIKEETDELTRQPVPRKYFSGGFVGRHVNREDVSAEDFAMMVSPGGDNPVDINVQLKPSTSMEPDSSWYARDRPRRLLQELQAIIKDDGTFDRPKLYAFLDRLLKQVESQRLNPGQGAWPALMPVTELSKAQESDLDDAVMEHYPLGRDRPALIDKILLMNDIFARDKELKEWVRYRAPHLVGRRVYLLAAEIHHWAGGLGPVMKFLAKGLKELGVDVVFIEAKYQFGINGTVSKDRFDEIPYGHEILTEGIERGVIQEVSRTEVKPNTRRTIQKYQIEEVGLNWDYVVGILTDERNGWADRVGPTELQLTADLNSIAGRLSTAFGGGENFGKIYGVLQRSNNIIKEQIVTQLAGANRGKLWDILKQPLKYTDPNIGITDIKEDVDHFILEEGDIIWNGYVVPQAFDNPNDWEELRQNGYIDSLGKILKIEEDYANFLPHRPGSGDKRFMFDTLKRLREKGIHQAWVQVDTGIDQNGITVYMFRDVLPDGLSSYYTKMLYNYKGRNNPVGKEESMAFINAASGELLYRLEKKRMAEQMDWKPAVVHSNDGQLAPLQAVTESKYGDNEAIKGIYWHFTTHTYRNRGDNADVNWAVNTFIKHMMGIKDRYINAFRNHRVKYDGSGRYEEYIDYTSPGVRLANSANGVSAKHARDVGKLDTNAVLYGIANAAAPEDMAKYYQKAFLSLFPDGDPVRPTGEQIDRVKRLTKEWLNEARIRTANRADGTFSKFVVSKFFPNGLAVLRKLIEQGVIEEVPGMNIVRVRPDLDQKKALFRQIVQENGGDDIEVDKIWGIMQRSLGFVNVDFTQPLLGYARRLVIEKAGRHRALTDDMIWTLVRLGYNVVLMGNHQGTEESERLASGLRDLEKRIYVEKGSERAAQYPGSFQFVQSFTPEDKKHFFAAEDIDVKDSDEHTGANEQTEEDGPANGAIQAGPNYNGEGEGAITAQGIEIDYEHPGAGQTAIPKEDTERSWLTTVYVPLSRLWKTNLAGFRENQALSPRLDRIQGYTLTAAAYAGIWENGLDSQEKDKWVDAESQANIINALGNDKNVVKAILYVGRNGVGAFGFRVIGQEGMFYPNGNGKTGLVGFVEKKEELEKIFGYDAFMSHFLGNGGHFINSDFYNYLHELFDHTPSAAPLDHWINGLENSEASTLQKYQRFGDFIKGLTSKLQSRFPQIDAAMTAVPGGIKLDRIPLERHGSLTAGIISDQGLEDLLLKAQGVTGVIESITPIPNLVDFIQ